MSARFLPLLPALLLLACAPNPQALPVTKPTSAETTATYRALRELPAPSRPVPVAVYNYPDLTGQFKAAETVATSSRAVTQGAVWMLVKSLKDAGAGRWFKVIQRANLDYLLKERQIIRETRGRVAEATGEAQPGLPSLLFAGVILDGGIIGYDSNTVTGGIGARYLGIGGDVQYRQDTVTVYLNAISSQTGEILKSVMTRKTVVSYGVRGSIFKFVAFQKLLEGEAGYTVNEPGQIALAQAIEHAVRSLVIEGALEGLWQFDSEEAGLVESQLYLAEKEDDLMLAAAAEGDLGSRSEAELRTLLAARKAERAKLAAKADQVRTRLARVAASQEKEDAGPTADARLITADRMDALMQILVPFEAETERLREQRQLSDAGTARDTV
ncbi:MAG: CsgG/HfaB family protein [Alphaproteobacteria bacterium]